MEKKKNKNKNSYAKKNFNKVVDSNEIEKTVKVEVEKVEEVKEVKKEVKKQDHGLLKIILIIILVVTLLTWLVKSGTWSYNANDAGQTIAEFTENEKTSATGINELFLSTYYAVNYYLIQIVFIALLGIFYGVVSKLKEYKALVKKIAKKFRNKETIFTLITTFVIAGFVSISTQPIVVLTFIPMLYSIAKELKMNKVSALMMTYGALAIGLMGVTYGTYALSYATQNMSVEITESVMNRVVILLAGYLLVNMFIVLYNKKNKNAEIVNDNFEVVESDDKTKSWPMAIVFGVLFIFMVLGYVNWTAFNVETFINFHTWLSTELVFGEDKTPVIYQILGNISEFGSWDPYVIGYIMLIIIIFIKFIGKVKFDEIIENALEGLKVVIKPIMIIAFAYSIFVICYWSGFVNPIINFFNSGDNFSPYLNTLGNVIADFLHIDVEYTGFSYAAFYASKFTNHAGQILACLTSASGIVTLAAPTSIFMITGLTLSDLSYKSWVKAIWKFLIALVIVVCLILTVITYL